MKPILNLCALIVFILCGYNVNAMTALSAEQLAKFDVQMDYNSDGSWWHSAIVSCSYANAEKTKINITSFYGRGTTRTITADVDWETGTLSYTPGVIDQIELNYVNNYFYFAPSAAVTGTKISSYTGTKLTGEISADAMTIDDPWAVVRVRASTGRIYGYGLKTNGPLKTRFVRSNATQTQLESSDGVTWTNTSYRVYVTQDFSKKATDNIVPTYVYCVNGANNCILMTLSREGLTSDSL
jgi:hypothetical protein